MLDKFVTKVEQGLEPALPLQTRIDVYGGDGDPDGRGAVVQKPLGDAQIDLDAILVQPSAATDRMALGGLVKLF